MKRAIVLSGLASFAMAIVGTLLAANLVAPAVADAQNTRIRAERLTIIDGDGVDRVLLRTIIRSGRCSRYPRRSPPLLVPVPHAGRDLFGSF